MPRPDATSAPPPPPPASALSPFDARAEALQRNLQRRLATAAGSRVAEPVANGATSHDVTFARREPDASYGVSVTPSWATTVRLAPADKSATGFTVHFGTAAGASDSIDWLVYRAG